MKQKNIILITASLIALCLVLVIGIVYIRNNSTSSQLPPDLNSGPQRVTQILQEAHADLNTHGLVLYENGRLERNEIVFKRAGDEVVHVTVLNIDSDPITFKTTQQPEGAGLPHQFTLEYNKFEEIYLPYAGNYVLQVEGSDQMMTLVVF